MLTFQVTSSFRCDFILRCFRHRLVIQSYHHQSNHTQIEQDWTKMLDTNLWKRGRFPPVSFTGLTNFSITSDMTSLPPTLRKEHFSFVRASIKAFKRLSPYNFWSCLYPPSTTIILSNRFLSRGNKARFSTWPPSLRSMIGGGIGPVLFLENISLTKLTNELWTINHLVRKKDRETLNFPRCSSDVKEQLILSYKGADNLRPVLQWNLSAY